MRFEITKKQIVNYLDNSPTFYSLEEIMIRRILMGIITENLAIVDNYSVCVNGTIKEVLWSDEEIEE